MRGRLTETLEGKVHYEAGNKIITGPNGEMYPITLEIFRTLYNDNGDDTATPKQIRKLAKLADHSDKISIRCGNLHYKANEDFIVSHGSGDYSVVKKDVFYKTYDTSCIPNLSPSVPNVFIRTIEPNDASQLLWIYYIVSGETGMNAILKLDLSMNLHIKLILTTTLWLLYILTSKAHMYTQIIVTFMIIMSIHFIQVILAYIIGYIPPLLVILFEKDLKHLYQYYSHGPNNKHNTCMYVAIVNNKIVGMAAVSDANIKKPGPFKGLRQKGDGELRRFNILPQYQGYKISQLLYKKITEYSINQRKYKRFILTTSTLQYVAYTYVYPSWGFKKIKTVSFFYNKIHVTFFAKNITSIE